MIEQKDWYFLKTVKYGYSRVFNNINLAQTKVIERLNGLLEPRNIEKENLFDIPENKKEYSISINKNFILISKINLFINYVLLF